ncbi:hypothetical protein Adt_39413 [Abeliophyllum distichum]|uniref:Uncharacterized protein n=1 Tax=Abeliophyllum distichum TaxID=126358 RepID=A0ABD1Q632_9LAMI
MAGEAAKKTEFRAALDGMMATAESAKAAYQKMSQDLADAEGNIAALTKRLDDDLDAEAITSTSLERLMRRKMTDLEASVKARSNVEGVYVNLLVEKKTHEEKLVGAEAEFTMNFHNTEAYASFSAFFASFG